MTNKRAVKCILCILAVIMVLFISSCNENIVTTKADYADYEKLINAFNSSEALLEQSNIQLWAKLDINTYESEKIFISELAKEANIKDYEIKETEESNIKKVFLTSQSSNDYIEIIIDTFKDEQGNASNLLINITTKENFNAFNYLSILDNILQKKEIVYKHSLLILGSYNEKTDIKEKCYIPLNILNAEIIEGAEYVENNEMISVSGFTKELLNTIEIGENKININVAVRYSDYYKKTFIWIGNPVIMTGY